MFVNRLLFVVPLFYTPIFLLPTFIQIMLQHNHNMIVIVSTMLTLHKLIAIPCCNYMFRFHPLSSLCPTCRLQVKRQDMNLKCQNKTRKDVKNPMNKKKTQLNIILNISFFQLSFWSYFSLFFLSLCCYCCFRVGKKMSCQRIQKSFNCKRTKKNYIEIMK